VLFDTEIGIARGYEFADIVLEETSGHGFDYGFNLWNGTVNKTLAQAQVDKWDHMLSELGLQPGDRLLDVGCGYGDWLMYAKSKGMKVMGINISPDQAKYATEVYGLKVINRNWKDFVTDKALQLEYYGTFDAVTFMDTVEHYVSNVHIVKETSFNPTEKECEAAHQTYYDMFEMAANMIDKNSPRKRVFSSMLHTTDAARRSMTFGSSLSLIILTRFHSGHYPPAYRCHCVMGDECTPDVEEPLGEYHGLAKYSKRRFNVKKMEDVTEDYRMTAIKAPRHFQSPVFSYNDATKLKRLFVKFLQDPYLIYQVLEFRWDCWMRMYGEKYTLASWDPEYRKTVSYQVCYWMTFELKD
jgi:cyclopropane fatty-acyl-phospholipid synthase-like methyltransferase